MVSSVGREGKVILSSSFLLSHSLCEVPLLSEDGVEDGFERSPFTHVPSQDSVSGGWVVLLDKSSHRWR